MPPKDSNKKKFATFADLNASGSGSGSGNSRDRPGSGSASPFGSRDERDPNDLYTGGEKSGLAVINPNNNNNNNGAGSSGASSRSSDTSSIGAHLVNEIMRHARENRPRIQAEDSDEEEYDEDDEESTEARKRRAFQGRGHQLNESSDSAQGDGDESEDTEDVFARQMEEYERARNTRVTRHLTFWRNGFTVEDSPLYRYDDPANIPHLRALDQGMAPLALLNVLPGQAVDLNVIQKKDEDYVEPKRKPGGYHGAGRRLGSPVPGEAHIIAGSSSTKDEEGESASKSSEAAAPAAPVSNEGEGDAVVQIRLADGSRHKHRFQSAGPVEQLYTFVDQILTESGGNSAGRTWVLQTTFPNRELTDRSQDLKAAGVVGAVVVQKLT
ncbi:uncharacterized protein SAPINGB_P000959 [Magnusiomyces paraingens]|uniref:UBX domain-containing protein n=1 Tax=Magnusiomyces paraingens TaxID=2606893 RepID=A0A5E8B394_9ASCO|nr:uncharacterized protein SAPINGB_P000959 [Saprochaete ingens]VVT45924.1 unnamed protein product [Saprochaete ingens]